MSARLRLLVSVYRERKRETLKIPAEEKDRADRRCRFAQLPLHRYNTIVNREGRAREGRV